ncbi:hypothetical protein B0H14DRAFT_2784153 [Mycena olivaceomarginata]|nr:hypothetical protein B0H14DRAFT_2784153 [Mycena olivaceomarginata]
MTFISLPVDLVDRLLMTLPNFETLQAAILSSKPMQSRSIWSDPALPSALNLLRYTPPDDPWVFGHATAEPTEVGVITPEDARKLARNAAVVAAFQDFFSHREKDRRFESSKLTPVESLRFTRALYRVMLFQQVFPGKTTIFIRDPDTAEEAEIRTARKIFFAMFPTAELREIHAVETLLDYLGWWLVGKVGRHPTYDQHSTVVPAAVFLQALQERSLRLMDDHFDPATNDKDNVLLADYIVGPLEDVLQDRAEPPLDYDFPRSKYILDHIEGESDTCKKCGANEGINLWTESNWEVQNNITLEFLGWKLAWLPLAGLLSENAFETAALREHLRAFRVQNFLRDLFALKMMPEYASWSPQDKLCERCLRLFMREHIHLWLLQQKREAGEAIPEDCRYGYDCPTQVHDVEHSKRLNHLCPPTKQTLER